MPLRDSSGKIVGLVGIARDITAHKRAEEALWESEQKYKTLTESSLTGIFIYQDGKYVFVNDRFAEIHGYKRKELLGKEHLTLIHPHERESVKQRISQRLKGKAVPQQYEVQRLRKDGKTIWCETMLTRIQYRGRPAVMGNVIDITERKRIEEALQVNKEKYRSLVESTDDSIYLVDSDCRYLFMNEKHLTRFDLPIDKVIGRTYGEFHSEEETKEFTKKVNEVFETGKSLWYEYRSQRDSRYFIRTLSPVKEPDGRTISVTVVSKDITGRKRAEEALWESEQKYKTLTESSLTGIFIYQDGKYMFVNDRFEEIYGYKREELLGKEHLTLIHPDERESVKQRASQRLKGKAVPQQYEVQRLRKDGKTIWCETMLTRIQYRGRPAIMGNVIDITERKQAEEELKSSREQLRNLSAYLQSAREQERTNIAREIHDEMGQTLTALKMDLSWLAKKLPKDQKSLLEKTRSMSELTDMTIKTVKKVSTELRPGLLDDLGLAAAMEWQAEEFQNRMGIKCELTLDPKDIMLDEKRSTAIFRIFQETLTNVARHAHATRIKVSFKEVAGTLELKVRDNGKGIAEKQISDPKSFGLIGIRERVHPWRGEVNISGIPDKGTTVTVSIPIGDLNP